MSLTPCLADPRTSSTQSLVSSVSDSDTRRKLLLIYIHGFCGNGQSFRSFPAHVHGFLRSLLATTHVIHSKVYPRYKTYKAIEVARDNFSAWLEPHESPETDVVLVGHSMGGLLAAEVVLLKPTRPPDETQFLKHRILGVVALDSPFLGLHPGIVLTGIASLFQSSPKPEDARDGISEVADGQDALHHPIASFSTEQTSSFDNINSTLNAGTASMGSPSQPSHDPYFDPPFHNDAHVPERSFLERMIHFTIKHKREGIFSAVGNHLTSHLEFGACLADYCGLNTRYKQLRKLEEVDAFKPQALDHSAGLSPKVRFVNYYTLSPGRRKSTRPETPVQAEKQKSARASAEHSQDHTKPAGSGQASAVDGLSPHDSPLMMAQFDGQEATAEQNRTGSANPQITALDDANNLSSEVCEDADAKLSLKNMRTDATLDPAVRVSISTPFETLQAEQSRGSSAGEALELGLPPIPDPPKRPESPHLGQITDKDSRKQAEKEAKRSRKAYEQAVKDRDKAIQEREKLLEKRRRKEAKDLAKATQQELETATREKHRLASELAKTSHQTPDQQIAHAGPGTPGQKNDRGKKRSLKTFCSLPGNSSQGVDETWIDVYMDDMDEVEAHCGLFLPGPHYEKLIGDVGMRIAAWVSDDLTRRAIFDAA